MKIIAQYATAREVALNTIRSQIVRGILKPGERLDIKKLADDIGISHVPIREACGHLEAEGLLTILPHRGTVVSVVSADDLKELYMMRMSLEPLAVDAGIRKLTTAQEKKMQGLLNEMKRLTIHGTPSELSATNKQYHFLLYEASGYSQLCRIVDGLWDHSVRYILLYNTQESLRSRDRISHD